jgi:hypothetical protein
MNAVFWTLTVGFAMIGLTIMWSSLRSAFIMFVLVVWLTIRAWRYRP